MDSKLNWRPAELAQCLDEATQAEPWAPSQVRIEPEVGSTNTALLEQLRLEPAASGRISLLAAERQTAGRGRLGRRWHSAQAGQALTFSLAMPMPASSGPSLSLMVAAVVADCLAGLAQAHPATQPSEQPSADARAPNGPPWAAPTLKLKWPNDLWLADASLPTAGRKLGGILIETTSAALATNPTTQAARMLVIGLGLNLCRTRELEQGMANDQAQALPGYGLATLDEILRLSTNAAPEPTASQPGPVLAAPELLLALAPALVRGVALHAREGLKPWLGCWQSRDLLLGQPVQSFAVGTGQAGLSGVARGVRASDGALLVQDPQGQTHALHSGEVSLRLAAASLN